MDLKRMQALVTYPSHLELPLSINAESLSLWTNPLIYHAATLIMGIKQERNPPCLSDNTENWGNSRYIIG